MTSLSLSSLCLFLSLLLFSPILDRYRVRQSTLSVYTVMKEIKDIHIHREAVTVIITKPIHCYSPMQTYTRCNNGSIVCTSWRYSLELKHTF